ncbi:CinA family protein [Alteromonas flava]|uniref:CinA family protein n=1 Tax=Alteromonas flava TaxID=2048003 RepID=UPI000C283A58|nr:CinA family protein [Alteromonas flava]
MADLHPAREDVQLSVNPTQCDLDALAARLGKLLALKGKHLSCAESCTGGGIAYAITSVSGSSAWFQRSWVTYANQAKIDALGVSTQTLDSNGAVSEQTAAEMLHGVQQRSGADVAVSVTGIAGPTGGTPTKPVGLVWFGFAVDQKEWLIAQQFSGDRAQVRRQAIAFALAFLVERLVE